MLAPTDDGGDSTLGRAGQLYSGTPAVCQPLSFAAMVGLVDHQQAMINDVSSRIFGPLDAAGPVERVGEDLIFPTLPTAVEAYRQRTGQSPD